MGDRLAFLHAPFPMVALYKTMNADDARRLEWAKQLADNPMSIGEAFAQTRVLAQYVNPEPFYDRARPKHPIAHDLRETKDVALRLAPSGSWHAVREAEDVGLARGDLDFAYLDRELEMLRTTRRHRQPDFDRPTKVVLDVLLCSSDGTPIVGEIKVKRDRDLTYALIQALACVSELASEHQVDRLRLHYGDRVKQLLADGPSRFDIYLLAVPRTNRDTYLTDLDGLAPELAAALLVQPSIATVVRRIVAIRTGLQDEALRLQAVWAKQAPPSKSPTKEPTPIEIDHVKAVRRSSRAQAEVKSDGPEGWSISDVNPANVVRCFPPLSLKPGLELHAYQYRAAGNGNGVIWAVPDGTPTTKSHELGAANVLTAPPRPPQATNDFMAAIDGDGSTWSYLCASILARELQELGALWHGCVWSDETVIATPPWTRPPCSDGAWEIADTSPEDWQLRQPLPDDWRPHAFRDGTAVVVRFYTYSPVGTATACENEDRYDGSGFTFQSRRLEVATGPGGIVY
jgi:hypothetical protein